MDTASASGSNGRKGPKRDEEAAARWRRLVADHEASGSTVRQFCRDRGVSEHSFYSWRRTLAARAAEDRGGYAKAMDDEFYRRQRELMGEVVAVSDVVITTAAVPGRKAPILVTGDMVKRMSPGAVIVDLAAERGGNCELSRPDETVVEHGVTVLGPTNLPSTVPYHASQMYARNISTLLLHLVKEGKLEPDLEDEITCETLVTRGGEVAQPRVREALGLAAEAAKTEEVAQDG